MAPRRLPPFQSLVAFEAVARLGSVRKAADELCLTPPAITYRIKELEDFLDVMLFSRTGSAMEISQAGRDYLSTILPLIERLDAGTRGLRDRYAGSTLRVQMLPVMASTIVLPELPDFLSRHPKIRLFLDMDHNLVDLPRESLHLSVRFGLGDWSGLWREPLMPITVTPVCAPAFARSHLIRTLQDLDGLPRLGLGRDQHSWPRFLSALTANDATIQSNDLTNTGQEILFGDYRLALDAARQGLGVALGVLPLIQPLLDQGELMAPLPIRLPIPEQYWLVAHEEPADDSPAGQFRHWLQKRISRLLQPLPQ